LQFVFWHCAKFETLVLKIQKTKEQTIFIFFVALKKTKLLVQTLNICTSPNKKNKNNKQINQDNLINE